MMFCELISSERIKRNMDMREFALLLEVSEATISRWEAAEFEPKRQTMKRIGEILNIELLDYQFDPPMVVNKSTVNFGNNNTSNNTLKEASAPFVSAIEIIKEQLVIKDEQLNNKDKLLFEQSEQIKSLINIISNKFAI